MLTVLFSHITRTKFITLKEKSHRDFISGESLIFENPSAFFYPVLLSSEPGSDTEWQGNSVLVQGRSLSSPKLTIVTDSFLETHTVVIYQHTFLSDPVAITLENIVYIIYSRIF